MPSFTLRGNHGRLIQLITDVGVCQAFDPHKTPTPPPVHRCKGLWDTGATGTVITDNIVKACGLAPISIIQVQTTAGTHLAEVYLVNVALPNGVAVAELQVTKGTLGPGIDVLIGMDIIQLGDFALTHGKGHTVFSFSIPATKEIDFVADAKTPLKLPPAIGRNSKCPCGSSKKYKHCCGAA